MLQGFDDTKGYLVDMARDDADEGVSNAAFLFKRFEDRYGEQIADQLIAIYVDEQKAYIAKLNQEADADEYQRSVEG